MLSGSRGPPFGGRGSCKTEAALRCSGWTLVNMPANCCRDTLPDKQVVLQTQIRGPPQGAGQDA